MSASYIELSLRKALLDDSKREACSFIKEKPSEDSKNQNIDESISETSWEKMPNELKQIAGLYLLKPNTIYPQPTARQAKIALSDRKNMDLPYIDRSQDDTFKYTIMPTAITTSAADKCICDTCNTESIEGFCYAITSGCIWALIGAPITLALISAFTPLGLFIDCGRATKRKCDNDTDEKLHVELTGPSRQEMR